MAASVPRMAKLTFILSARARPGRRDAVRAPRDRHLRPRAEEDPSQELYLFCYDESDADAFHLVEAYSDDAAARRNATAPWFAEYMREAEPLLPGRPSLLRARPVWTKGVALG